MFTEFLCYAGIPIVILNALGLLLGYFFQTDKFTDITYSLSFIVALLCMRFLGPWEGQYFFVVALFICIWAIRLGSFLLYRINKMGRDRRFDDMRSKFFSFSKFWILQTVTVVIILIPIAFIEITPFTAEWPAIFGSSFFLTGFIIQWISDQQKLASSNKGLKPWELPGLWKIIRHPNYLGEIFIWVGIFTLTIPFLSSWKFIAILSPVWIALLLIKVSGIPLIEDSRKIRYNKEPKYSQYLSNTSRLIPGIY